MADRNERLMTGMFRDRDTAERAYGCVTSRGYTDKDVSLLMSNDTRTRCFPRDAVTKTELGTKATEGAGIGAVTGGGLGALLAGLAAAGIAVPVLPIIALGPLAAALAGGASGGAVGAVIGALIGYGIPEERAKLYERGINEGGIVLGVTPRTDEDADYIERGWTDARGEQIYRSGVDAAGEAAMTTIKGIVAGALAAAMLVGGGGLASAQAPATSPPAAAQMAGRHSVDGEVTKVDAKKGWIHLKTADGTMIMHFPPTDLQTLKKGDRITVSLALKDNGPAPK